MRVDGVHHLGVGRRDRIFRLEDGPLRPEIRHLRIETAQAPVERGPGPQRQHRSRGHVQRQDEGRPHPSELVPQH